MGIIEILLIAVGLSMDAFAVALCKGLHMRTRDTRQAIVIALFFGVFQAVMPLIGWALGKQFENYIQTVDHWIAFVLLSIIGGKMLYEAFHKEACPDDACAVSTTDSAIPACGDRNASNEKSFPARNDKLNIKELLALAVATSIDALTVGITFAFLKVSILPAVSLIGMTTFILSFAGVFIGHSFGTRLKTKAEVAGGVVLILIGLKILLGHLGILPF